MNLNLIYWIVVANAMMRSWFTLRLKISFHTCPWYCGSEMVLSFQVKWGIEQLSSTLDNWFDFKIIFINDLHSGWLTTTWQSPQNQFS